ncbi:ketosteroid isomerase-like protein [Kitasatospora sp. MAA4]|uniref:nuclear transport factor 2 family protein n=1 Tax=Kitasatospora sp. MAA4 TaxID=3035093 RepID=UPI002473CCB5|nr:nuclear transport factor 2 family protein [Kitasatospora sp. MAA4]MDH6131111.1 ketosteroid isomerase-like protein [Kitasatospora sp. MAA4]
MGVGKDVVNRFFEAGLRDDIQAAADCFAPDARWIMAEGAEPGTTYTKAEIPAFLEKIIGLRKEYEAKGITLEYGELLEVQDRVVLEFSVLSPEGKVLDRAVDLFTIQDGLIAVKDVFRKA